MAGIADPNVIDVVAQDADGSYLLIMVEERPWDGSPQQAMQLREKINAYAGAVIDGTIAKHYPETSGHPLRIQLDCVQQPVGEIARVIEHAAEQLSSLGLGFHVKVRS